VVDINTKEIKESGRAGASSGSNLTPDVDRARGLSTSSLENSPSLLDIDPTSGRQCFDVIRSAVVPEKRSTLGLILKTKVIDDEVKWHRDVPGIC
jgi:hypothetical protein